MRDRLFIARDLLTPTGSVFVPISDENVHHVREIMDEVFGPENFVSLITFAKTTGATIKYLPSEDERDRVEVLFALALSSPPALRVEIFAKDMTLIPSFFIGDRGRSKLYSRIVSAWSKDGFYDFQPPVLLSNLFHVLAHHTRRELLEDLAALVPLIVHLGGKAAIEDFFYALRDVTQWWP